MLEIDFSYLPFIKLAFVLIRKYHKSELNSSDDFIHFGFFTLNIENKVYFNDILINDLRLLGLGLKMVFFFKGNR
jgi:hypothetical protein